MSAQSINGAHGKWSKLGVPHRDWYCVDVYDNFDVEGEKKFRTCEMCEQMEIRYVHIMRHDHYPDELHCGCVCAGNMEKDKTAAKKRERVARNRTKRRENFLSGKHWRKSAGGTLYANRKGFNMVVVKRNTGWVVGIMRRGGLNNRRTWGKKTYETEEVAKVGCFEALEWMMKQ